MTPPRLVSVWFGQNERYQRMAAVLAYTAAKHCPHWDVRIERMTATPISWAHPMANQSHIANTQKMEAWHAIVEQSADGDRLLLIDADMAILRPLDDLWDLPFDYAYTVKQTDRFPFNSGVIALRVGPQTRAFIAAWRHQNRSLLRDQYRHQDWRRQYGGINQAALGAALTLRDLLVQGLSAQEIRQWRMPQGDATKPTLQPFASLADAEIAMMREALVPLDIRQLPCAEWNCEDSSWKHFDPAVTRILHVKSQLRSAIFGDDGRPAKAEHLVDVWRRLERQMLAERAMAS